VHFFFKGEDKLFWLRPFSLVTRISDPGIQGCGMNCRRSLKSRVETQFYGDEDIFEKTSEYHFFNPSCKLMKIISIWRKSIVNPVE
jgi:hypothetical protein